jgi:hypothetical protein
MAGPSLVMNGSTSFSMLTTPNLIMTTPLT